MSCKVVILSPHLDDAVFDCCDHILHWQRQGTEVSVITVFASFSAGIVSNYLRRVMDRMNIASVEEFEAVRRNEDKQAMRALGVRWEHWDFIDAAFRKQGDRSAYATYRELCSGQPQPCDGKLFEQLLEAIQTRIQADLLVIPFGVGQHQDHLLVRRAAEQSAVAGAVNYYLDFPYARNPFRWRLDQWAAFTRSQKSIKWMSSSKRSIMRHYASQVQFIFRTPPLFPEIILS